MGIDQTVLSFLVENRSEWLSFFALVITYSGDYILIGGLTFLSAVSFHIHKHTARILPLFVAVGGSAATVYIIKHLFYRARPVAEALYLETGSSLPSGHATMAMALYGFLLYIIWSQSAKETLQEKNHLLHKLLTVLLGTLIILIGVSRLYLGVHYLSDVLLGYFIGFVWILISLAIPKLKIWLLPGSEHL